MNDIRPLLIEDEKVMGVYKAMRDYCVFTDKRVIAVNVQGLTGRKKRLHVIALFEGDSILRRNCRLCRCGQ